MISWLLVFAVGALAQTDWGSQVYLSGPTKTPIPLKDGVHRQADGTDVRLGPVIHADLTGDGAPEAIVKLSFERFGYFMFEYVVFGVVDGKVTQLAAEAMAGVGELARVEDGELVVRSSGGAATAMELFRVRWDGKKLQRDGMPRQAYTPATGFEVVQDGRTIIKPAADGGFVIDGAARAVITREGTLFVDGKALFLPGPGKGEVALHDGRIVAITKLDGALVIMPPFARLEARVGADGTLELGGRKRFQLRGVTDANRRAAMTVLVALLAARNPS